jgi:hypothetical protein
MSYPYLPVNSCCTDVVINDPCGCSSTITNSGCNNNPCGTNVTLSSTIVYNGPALTCTTAEPCDTLNVILQKIDEIICNLLSQINTLNIQVTNINNQLITINGDIDTIYDTLSVCCVTTTSTTTIRPCENFSLENTGVDPVAIIITNCNTNAQEAIVLLPGDTNICVVTDSPFTVPGTVIVTPNGPCFPPTTSTTSTSSTSSTTTTTTTAIACECLTFHNTDVIDHTVSYITCSGTVYPIMEIVAGQIIQACGSSADASDPLVTISIGANCVGGVCPTTTTTTTVAPPTTTTTTTVFACTSYSWAASGDNISDLEYTNCDNLYVKIDRVDVTDNSGFICVYPGTTPIWNPTPSSGYHDISSTGVVCTKS